MALNAKDMRGLIWIGLGCLVVAGVGLDGLIEGVSTGAMIGRRGIRYAWSSDPGGFVGCAMIYAVMAIGSLGGLAYVVRTLLKGPYRPSFVELEQARAETPPVVHSLR